jgi:hypothetical protein
MKKLLSGAAFLLLTIGMGTSLQAAECPRATPLSQAALTLAVPPQGVSPTEPMQLATNANLAGSTVARRPPNDCRYLACEQTPTGCACEGFYCGDLFICGIPWF